LVDTPSAYIGQTGSFVLEFDPSPQYPVNANNVQAIATILSPDNTSTIPGSGYTTTGNVSSTDLSSGVTFNLTKAQTDPGYAGDPNTLTSSITYGTKVAFAVTIPTIIDPSTLSIDFQSVGNFMVTLLDYNGDLISPINSGLGLIAAAMIELVPNPDPNAISPLYNTPAGPGVTNFATPEPVTMLLAAQGFAGLTAMGLFKRIRRKTRKA